MTSANISTQTSDVSISTSSARSSRSSHTSKDLRAKSPSVVSMDDGKPQNHNNNSTMEHRSDDHSWNSGMSNPQAGSKAQRLRRFFSKSRSAKEAKTNESPVPPPVEVKLDMREAFQMTKVELRHKLAENTNDLNLLRRREFDQELSNARAISDQAREIKESRLRAVVSSTQSSEAASVKSQPSQSENVIEVPTLSSIEGGDVAVPEEAKSVASRTSFVTNATVAATLKSIYKHGKEEYERCLKFEDMTSPNSYQYMRNGVLDSINELVTDDSYKQFDIVDFMESLEVYDENSVFS